jgi:hypothetical protein
MQVDSVVAELCLALVLQTLGIGVLNNMSTNRIARNTMIPGFSESI